MNTMDVLVVRIYVTESSGILKKVMDYLKKDAKIHAVSVFRAISGFDETGSHSASLIDVSLDLMITIEFFDTKDKVESALEKLNQMIKPEHILFWEAKASHD